MELEKDILLHGGTYRIEKALGQGSFGITYLATHTALTRKVAIKEFFMKELNTRGEDGSISGMTDGSLSFNYGQKFKKEAINLSQLDHPNIVRVTDSFEENGTFYYVMDYIEGENLNDYLKHNAISQQEAVSIITDVAKALQYMHDTKHMLHLDLKPGNIMRRASDGHIFLIDFGLSKHYSNSGQPETSTTIGLGTAGYAPIEQSNHAKNGEFRPTIDVYALGATLYKLLTGQTPPVASDLVSDDELLVESLAKYNVKGAIVGVIEKAMMPSVKKRTQSIRAFIDSLPNVDDTSSSATATNTVEAEETEYISEVEVGEETVFVSENIEKHPNFDESTYVIETKYKNYPTSTATEAQDGDNDAAIAYGMMALRGQGVKQDFDAAYSWFAFAKNNGDDRGEKMINQWTVLKSKYNSSNKEHDDNNKPKAGNTNISNGSNSGLWIVGAIIFIIVLIFSVKSCKGKREAEEKARIEAAAAAEKARIESIARNTKDWYGTGNGQFYCMVEGKKHYVGTYGIPDGQRTVYYSSGDTFVGTFKGGRKSQGKLTYKNGDYFDGTFSNGSWDTGYGKNTTSNYSYEGNYKNGMFHGHGTYKNSKGDWLYEGNFENGNFNGLGKERWPKERRSDYADFLECNYVNDKRHGVGTWYFRNHTYRKCRFKNGKEVATIEEGTWR